MENKTIRVWDKEVEFCGECNYLIEWNTLTCAAIGEVNDEVQYYDVIDKKCPFSKPL